MSEKREMENTEDSLLKSPTCTISLPERESPFRKKKRMEAEVDRSEVKDRSRSDGHDGDNSNFLKGLRQLRGVTDARLTSPSARGSLRSSGNETTRSPRSSVRSPAGCYEAETDAVILARREKQIEYGKITREYSNYIKAIPKEDRCDFHPRTPNMKRKYSRRAWDGLIKQWRLNLHIWSDTPQPELDFSQNGVIRKRRIESGSDRTESPDSSDVHPDENVESDESTEPLNKTVLKKKSSFTDRIDAESDSILSSSWADEVEEYQSELQD